MTTDEVAQPRDSRARLLTQELLQADTIRFGASFSAREEHYFFWFGGFIAVVWGVVALVLVASSQGGLPVGDGPSVFAAGQSLEVSIALTNRTGCAEIGSSDLRSPREGLWFQSNCVAVPQAPLVATNTFCNRTSLNPAEFASLGSGLFVSRQAPGSQGWLWYESSEACFDLVSTRVVTAVCLDQTVSFNWNASACAAHGGVLAWINGR
jgi:hypothetical protein